MYKSELDYIIKISADDISQLRKCDVYRVLNAAIESHDKLFDDMVKYIKTMRPDLIEEVEDCTLDLCG